MQIKESSEVYDVIIVGSGAGGGMATKQLADAGLNVAVVEAGPYFDPKDPKTMTQLKWPYESPRRGARTDRAFGEFDMAYGGWEIEGEPYTREEGTEFDWFRSHMLGGRTNHWGRISLRFGPKDFKGKDRDGHGENWPIGYDDVKPYYDKVDKLIGVFGTNEGLEDDPDGFFLPPPKPRLHELFYIKGAQKSGIPVIPARKSILTKRINNERGVCFYCRQCGRSCSIYADFSSGSCLIFPAQQNGGRVKIFVNSVVREVTTNEEGRATGVSYISKDDRKEYKLKGKVVILAASACSSARILLNSKSKQHPNGLGNSSDLVGKYLHDSTGASKAGFIPALMNRKVSYNEDGVNGMHVYSPWWGDNSKLNFPRGYHIELGGGMGMPNYGFAMNHNEFNKFFGLRVGGYGDSIREDVKKYYGSVIGMAGRGEAIARKDNFCEIDPTTVDQFGIPVLKFNYKWSDFEINQAKHMQDTFEEIIHNMGGEPISETPSKENHYGLEAPGRIIHEVGTTRMGDDPKSSVTNRFQQLHDANNVFITDAGPFVSQGDKNCTWTILALSWRASDYIIEQLKQQNI
ncbi:GMC family oxidoreductase [uncultured Kriegella sp.]|uniref:GMC family oxidoreductase n=1 Tax=uncultured Kriegella sp. TaxID=1798910 RepID=UPI0030D83B5B|tara:strand:+ start:39718 stop:41439 length:1722 start_codon:yes stop_codon:yes gene_type:complete